MLKRRTFVPEASPLEGRVVMSTFGDIGHWFSSQYHHVVNDIGGSHKHSTATSDGISKLRNEGAKAARPVHNAHTAPTPLVTSSDTVKNS